MTIPTIKLIPEISSISEKDFKESLSEENKNKINQISENALSLQEHKCAGCDIEDIDEGRVNKLTVHIISGNPDDINSLKLVHLCLACHAIKHFDKAVENEWVLLVNSSLTQRNLMHYGRAGNYASLYKSRDIIVLKKTPLEYLNELRESETNRNDKIKIIFTKKFQWL